MLTKVSKMAKTFVICEKMIGFNNFTVCATFCFKCRRNKQQNVRACADTLNVDSV